MNSDSHDPSTGPEAPKTTQQRLDELSETLTEAIKKGGRDARRAFDEGFPKAKQDFVKGIHDVAYALAYAAAFGAGIAREITPDALREGLREGAASGRRAADEAIRQRRERAARESANEAAGSEGFDGSPA